jgi:hypothetical protein
MSRKKFPARSAVSAVARPTFIFAFGALAVFTGLERASAGEDLLQTLKPVTDAALTKPAAEDWLKWSRLSEQIFRIDKWSLCQG